MGAKQTKTASIDTVDGHAHPAPLSLADKEAQAEMNTMIAYSEHVQRVSQEPQKSLARSQVPQDNSAFSGQAFVQQTLPLDDQGFVQSFHVEQKQEIREFFEKYGLVVVRNAISQDEADRSAEELWDAVERCCKRVRRDDPNTWDNNNWSSLHELGFLGSHVVLSPQFCDNRQNPNVHQAFSTILGTDELHVNVSRASLMRPTKGVLMGEGLAPADKPEWRTMAPEKWLHWDMNPWTGAATSFSWKVKSLEANRGYERLCVQGIIALGDCGREDGGFCCVPGSHSFIRTWAHHALSENPDITKKVTSPYGPMQFKIPVEDPLVQHIQKAPVRAGSLLVWDTKLAHCNFPNSSNRPRLVQYIAMKRADDPAFEPEFNDKSLLPDSFELSALGERLYGFKPFPIQSCPQK